MNKKAQLRRKADKLWFQILIKRNPFCLVCNKGAIQVHHFIPKGRCSVLRYNRENGVSVCQGCHLKIHTGDPRPVIIIKQKKGKEWYDRLEKISNKPPTSSCQTIGYYQEVMKQLEK